MSNKIICRYNIVRIRRNLIKVVRYKSLILAERQIHMRRIRALKAIDNSIHQRWIDRHNQELVRLNWIVEQVNGKILQYFNTLIPWLNFFDSISTFRERVSVLGVNHIGLGRRIRNLGRDPEKIGMLALIVVYNGEIIDRRGDGDFVPRDQTRMPLFSAFLQELERLLMNDPSVADALGKFAEDFLSSMESQMDN
jgi:hypothetical protein